MPLAGTRGFLAGILYRRPTSALAGKCVESIQLCAGIHQVVLAGIHTVHLLRCTVTSSGCSQLPVWRPNPSTPLSFGPVTPYRPTVPLHIPIPIMSHSYSSTLMTCDLHITKNNTHLMLLKQERNSFHSICSLPVEILACILHHHQWTPPEKKMPPDRARSILNGYQ
jgi:hypothetical protein